MSGEPTEVDIRLLREAVSVAAESRRGGNHPFGAVLADRSGSVLLTAGNTCMTESDVTGHAELNLVRTAYRLLGRETAGEWTLYSSAEPCAMCAGAIYWSGIGRVAYAISERRLLELTGDDAENPTMSLPCRTVLGAGQRTIEVLGPLEVEGSVEVHRGFWHP